MHSTSAGITRSRARAIKAHGFKVLPHGRTGSKAATTGARALRRRQPSTLARFIALAAADNPVAGERAA